MDRRLGSVVADRLPWAHPPRLAPNGNVALYFGCYLDGIGPWLVVYLADGALKVQVFTDVDVADWPELHPRL